jgi:hypothetical protein
MAGGEAEKSLEQTPTWAVASVCTVFVVCSLLVERGIFSFGRVSSNHITKLNSFPFLQPGSAAFVFANITQLHLTSLLQYLKRNKQKELFHTLEVIRNGKWTDPR